MTVRRDREDDPDAALRAPLRGPPRRSRDAGGRPAITKDRPRARTECQPRKTRSREFFSLFFGATSNPLETDSTSDGGLPCARTWNPPRRSFPVIRCIEFRCGQSSDYVIQLYSHCEQLICPITSNVVPEPGSRSRATYYRSIMVYRQKDSPVLIRHSMCVCRSATSPAPIRSFPGGCAFHRAGNPVVDLVFSGNVLKR